MLHKASVDIQQLQPGNLESAIIEDEILLYFIR